MFGYYKNEDYTQKVKELAEEKKLQQEVEKLLENSTTKKDEIPPETSVSNFSLPAKQSGLSTKIELIRASKIEGAADFANMLNHWVSNGLTKLDSVENHRLLNIAVRSCDLLLYLSNNKLNKKDYETFGSLLNKLKDDLPSTTFGRCVLGIINALLVPLFAILETFKLLGGDAEYRYTKSVARDCTNLFRSPIAPAIDIIDDLFKVVKELKVDNDENHSQVQPQ